jgi:hypothetical protein
MVQTLFQVKHHHTQIFENRIAALWKKITDFWRLARNLKSGRDGGGIEHEARLGVRKLLDRVRLTLPLLAYLDSGFKLEQLVGETCSAGTPFSDQR